jgi:hypothetical protein
LHIRCPGCGSEISICTDPEEGCYDVEFGARRTRRFGAKRVKVEGDEDENEEEWEEVEYDVIQRLEEKAVDAKTDMAVADALDSIRIQNARV